MANRNCARGNQAPNSDTLGDTSRINPRCRGRRNDDNSRRNLADTLADAYNQGYKDGYNDGFTDGRQQGFIEGYRKGVEAATIFAKQAVLNGMCRRRCKCRRWC